MHFPGSAGGPSPSSWAWVRGAVPVTEYVMGASPLDRDRVADADLGVVQHPIALGLRRLDQLGVYHLAKLLILDLVDLLIQTD